MRATFVVGSIRLCRAALAPVIQEFLCPVHVPVLSEVLEIFFHQVAAVYGSGLADKMRKATDAVYVPEFLAAPSDAG